MIKTEREYQDALRRLEEDQNFIKLQRKTLEELGLNNEEVERGMEPTLCFHAQLKEEVDYYEKIKRGEFGAVINLYDIGRFIIGLRIYMGLSQTELAKKLGVSEAQVSRDEKNEYHGITAERIQKVLDALGVKMKSEFELPIKKAG